MTRWPVIRFKLREVLGRAYEWHAREIPKDNHEAPFLVEHVPSLRDALLSLGAKMHMLAQAMQNIKLKITYHALI